MLVSIKDQQSLRETTTTILLGSLLWICEPISAFRVRLKHQGDLDKERLYFVLKKRNFANDESHWSACCSCYVSCLSPEALRDYPAELQVSSMTSKKISEQRERL